MHHNYKRLDFYEFEFAISCIQLTSLGAYLGILCDTKFFGGTHREVHDTSIVKGILRTLLTLLFFVPFIYTIDSRLLNHDFLTVLILVFVLPSFLSSFIFYAFSRILFKRCRLVTSEACNKRSEET